MISEKTKLRAGKINHWCLEHSSDFFTNLIRDLKSLKALWNYLMLILFTWVCVYCVLFHATTSANTVIVTVGGLVGTIFAGYVWSSTAEKKAAKQFPAYQQKTERTQETSGGQVTQTTTDTQSPSVDDQNG